MKTNQTKIHLLLAALSMLIATAATSVAGERSDGTRGGGQVVRDGKKLSLKDFIESTVCKWEPGSSWLNTMVKNRYMPNVLKNIRNTNWLFANQYERAAKTVKVCWTGKLQPLDTNDPDAVTTTKIYGEQVAIFLFDTNEIFIDEALVRETTSAVPDFETYLFFHEVGHTLIPRDSKMRNTKLGSLVNALRLHTKKPMSTELFNFQLTQAEIGVPDYTDDLPEPMRTDCRLGLSAQPTDQNKVAAHRCYKTPGAERIFGKDFAYLTSMERQFNDLGSYTERPDRRTLTDEKALEIAKNLTEQGYDSLLNLIGSAIDANFPETTKYLFSIIDSKTEIENSNYLLSKTLAKKDPAFLNAYLANPRLAKNITTVTNLWEEVFNLNVSPEVFQTLWENKLLNPNAQSKRTCFYEINMANRAVLPQSYAYLKIYKTTTCRHSRDDERKSGSVDMNDPVLVMAIRLNRLDIVQTLLSAPNIDLDATSIVTDNSYSNSVTYNGGTPLLVAVVQQNTEALKLLLQHPRINPNMSALNNSKLVGTHPEQSTDPRATMATELSGVTPLMLSVYFGDIQATQLLLEHPKTSTKSTADTQSHMQCAKDDPIKNIYNCSLYRYIPQPPIKTTALEIADWTETRNGPELAKMIVDVRKKQNREAPKKGANHEQ